MDRTRESFWQDRWSGEGLAKARRVPGREKFYALFAYPGASGFLHVGYLRGMTYTDALHRYHRMLGRQVFFPTGTHASGLPAVSFAQKVQERDPTTVQQLEDNGVPRSEWPRLEDPAYAARYLGRNYLAVYRRLGMLVDESAYLTTIDEDYQAFIRWQFGRLKSSGSLGQGVHFSSVCPVCGPVSVDPSETDLSSGGDAEWITYTTVPFRLDDGRVLLAATLRPETIYGVTNVWVPTAGPLVVWHHQDQEFLVGRIGGERLVEQHGGRLGHEVQPMDLVGRSVQVPLTDRRVPLLASALVDPGRGTGVVMSVPAHAPADWLALAALAPEDRSRIGPVLEIIVLPVPGELTGNERGLLAGEGPPAERAARATGARGLEDAGPLAEATERLYRVELVRGRMRPDLLDGVPVGTAREIVARELKAGSPSFDLQEFSKPVICRNGHEVIIRRVPNQWFLRYGDTDWKNATRDLIARMSIRPKEYHDELPGILDWYQDRPCTRRGRWLGTPFPFDPDWLIEPIADSTFYPAYFPIRRYVSDGRVPIDRLSDAFFDRVILGEGPGEPGLDRKLQDEIRSELTYWYPLDVNIGGKEHKRVHFPVFLYTHARLLPPELQPRRIMVHWWIIDRSGSKISKKQVSSKGGAIPPFTEAFERWGADALRLFSAQSGSPFQDVEWDAALVDQSGRRLEEIERLVRQLDGAGSGTSPELELWLESELHVLVRRTHEVVAELEMRDLAELVYARIPALFRRFIHRGGGVGPATSRFVGVWLLLMSPITPHLAEELGERRFDGLVAVQRFPAPEDLHYSPSAIEAEAFLSQVEEDVQSVLRPSEVRGEHPEAIFFFVAAPWKRLVESWLRADLDRAGGASPLKGIMERAKQHPELRAYLAQIPRYVEKVSAAIRSEGGRAAPEIDEVALLRGATGFLARRFQFEDVRVFQEDLAEGHDPHGRRERARPGRPAFYLTGVVRPSGPPP
jgi:leucyl-tRNA synthetase